MEDKKKSQYLGYTPAVAKAQKKYYSKKARIGVVTTPEIRTYINAYAAHTGISLTKLLINCLLEKAFSDPTFKIERPAELENETLKLPDIPTE